MTVPPDKSPAESSDNAGSSDSTGPEHTNSNDAGHDADQPGGADANELWPDVGREADIKSQVRSSLSSLNLPHPTDTTKKPSDRTPATEQDEPAPQTPLLNFEEQPGDDNLYPSERTSIIDMILALERDSGLETEAERARRLAADESNTESDSDYSAEIDGFPVIPGGDDNVDGDTVERLASEFVESVRAGERPDMEEYISRQHPKAAAQLRELLPLITTLESWKTQKEAECIRRSIPADFSLERLGDCRIVREIGRGGMGVVFEAIEDGIDRRVAVKLLPWRFAAALPRWRDRFHKEAVTVARLRHRNIVPVYRFGEHDGYCYFVMPVIEGVSLGHLIGRLSEHGYVSCAEEIERAGMGKKPADGRNGLLRRDSWKRFATVIVQAAQALAYAHEQGVIHNDIKPGNLLVDAAGRVYVSDFGIAQNLETDFADEQHDITGTLRYMAPERLDGSGDFRSDVYSLGITLYELVTQTPAFNEDDRIRLAEQVLTTTPVDPRSLQPEMPADLASIVSRTISANPDDRYQTARELVADLLCFLNDRPVKQPVTGGLRSFWKKLFHRGSADAR